MRAVHQVRPAPGPGSGVTPKDLAARWATMPAQAEVISLFDEDDAWGCFSNCYCDGLDSDFVIPPEFFATGLRAEEERTVTCAFSEKAIMLCKAAVMGDDDTLAQISAASTPGEAREVGPGD